MQGTPYWNMIISEDMKITAQTIRGIMGNAPEDRIAELVSVFNEWADRFEINTKLRAAHWIAQISHESNELRCMEENLNYSADGLMRTFPKYFTRETAAAYARNPQKIANRVYANRMGNGNEASGDGWRYRGRGVIQLTGKSNYQSYASSEFCVGDLMKHPEWLAKSPGCFKSAMYYWWKNGLNELADKDDPIAVTKRINGGENGLAQRMYFTRKAKKALWI